MPCLFLALWAFIARELNNEVILPGVGQVAELFVQPTENLIAMGSLTVNVAISVVRVLGGLSAGGLPRRTSGVFLWATTEPSSGSLTVLSHCSGPSRRWPVPLVLAWFGVASLATLFDVQKGLGYVYLNNLKFSMIFIIFIGAFYPILTSTIHGVMNVRSTLLDSARVLGASERDIFRKILLPAFALHRQRHAHRSRRYGCAWCPRRCCREASRAWAI